MSIGLLIAVFLIGTMLFSLHLIGGGDVKLLAAAAATAGWPHVMPFLIYTIFAGALLGIAVALFRGQLRASVFALWSMTLSFFAGVSPASVQSAAGSMPYGVAIFAGAGALAVTNAFVH